MGSADDDDELEPERPKPAYQVSHPTLAWELRTETIRAKPAPTRDREPNPQEPNDSQKALPPRFELNEIDQLREREAQAAPPAPAFEIPPATENAAQPSERPRDYGQLHRTHDAVRLDAAARARTEAGSRLTARTGSTGVLKHGTNAARPRRVCRASKTGPVAT